MTSKPERTNACCLGGIVTRPQTIHPTGCNASARLLMFVRQLALERESFFGFLLAFGIAPTQIGNVCFAARPVFHFQFFNRLRCDPNISDAQ